MAKLYNLARVNTTTTGTGPLTPGSAVSGWLTFAAAGVQDGDVITYAIRDGGNSEIGHGTYSGAGPTLTRDTILKSTNSGLAISLSGAAQVFITPAAEDLSVSLGAWNYWKIRNITPGNPLSNTTIASLEMRAAVGGAAQTVSSWTASSGTATNAANGTGWTPLAKQTITGSFGAHTLGDSAPWLKMFFSTAVSVAEIALTSATADQNALRTFDVWVSNDDLTYFLVTSFDGNPAGGAQTFRLPNIMLGLIASVSTGGSVVSHADMDIGPYAPPTASWFDTTTAKNVNLTNTLTDVSGRGLQVAISGTNLGDQSALCLRSTSGWGTSYTVTARIIPAARTGSFATIGLCAYDSSNGKFVIVGSEQNGSSGMNILVQRRTNVSAFSSNTQLQAGQEHPTWHKLARSGANLTYSISWDGVNWFDFTESATAFLTAVPTHIGLAFVGGNSSGGNASQPFGVKLVGGLVTYYDDPDHAASAIQQHIAAAY